MRGAKTRRGWPACGWMSPSIVMLLVTFWGCGDARRVPPGAVSRDHPSIAENDEPLWRHVAPWAFDSTPRLRIPRDDSTFFHRVADADLSGDGELLIVADAGRDELLLFNSATGEILDVWGGRGDGPGEFRSLGRVSWSARDTIVAWETNGARITWFDMEGHVIATSPGPRRPAAAERWFPAPGPAVFIKQTDRGTLSPPGGVVRPERPLVRISWDGVADTLAVFPGPEMIFADLGQPVRIPVRTLLGPDTEVAAGGASWRLVAGDGALPAFSVFDEHGAQVRIVRWREEAPEVAEADLRRVREARIAAEVSLGRTSEEANRSVSLLPPPRRAPIYDDLFVDDHGFVWARRYPFGDVEPGTWIVFSTEGEWMGDLTIPYALRPLVARDSVFVGLRTDSLGVQSVYVMHLGRAG